MGNYAAYFNSLKPKCSHVNVPHNECNVVKSSRGCGRAVGNSPENLLSSFQVKQCITGKFQKAVWGCLIKSGQNH